MNANKWNVIKRYSEWVAYPPLSFDGIRFRSWRAAYSYAHWASRRD